MRLVIVALTAMSLADGEGFKVVGVSSTPSIDERLAVLSLLVVEPPQEEPVTVTSVSWLLA